MFLSPPLNPTTNVTSAEAAAQIRKSLCPGRTTATVLLKAGVAFLWRFLTVGFLDTSLLCEALFDLFVLCIGKDEQLIQKLQSYSEVSLHATSTGILSGKKSFLKYALFSLCLPPEKPRDRGGPARVADGQAVGRALRGAPPHAGAPGGAVLPVRLGCLQQLGARRPRRAHVQVAQREVARLQVQADAVVEGEALAAGVGHCVARPGGPQELLVLSNMPLSSLTLSGSTLPPAPMRRSPGHTLMLCGLFCVIDLSHPWVVTDS